MASHERMKAALGLAAIFGGLAVSSLAGGIVGTEVSHLVMTHHLLSLGDTLSGPVDITSAEGKSGLAGSFSGMALYMTGLSFLSSRRKS